MLPSILRCSCPRCRKGSMFLEKNPYKLRRIFDMPTYCTRCGQKFELEVGFWYGTGYVSYGLAVALSVFNLAWYWLIFGLSVQDNSIYYWLIANSIILVGLMPYLMRLSRVLYLYMFVRYDAHALNRDQKPSSAS